MSLRTQSSSDPQFQLRPRRARCKTGCICCRLRKKKCDERKPVCTGCSKLGLTCSWLESEEFAWRVRMGLSRNIDVGSSLDRENPPPAPSRGLTPPEVAGSISQRLLQRYVEQITPFLLTVPVGSPNPFVGDVLPLAFSDVLVMNAVLAVGGSVVMTIGADKTEEERILQCYGEAIRGLKSKLADWIAGSLGESECVRLFLTIILLAVYEVMRGNQNGTLLHHLRGGRYFIEALYECRDPTLRPLVGVSLELYAFWELCFNLRMLPSQADVDAISSSPMLSTEGLRRYDTFGVVFGEFSALFRLIPQICQLALDRNQEFTEAIQDSKCEETFLDLTCAITEWESDSDGTSIYSATTPKEQEHFARGKKAAETVIRNALLLFLWSAYFKDESATREMSQPLVDIMIQVLPDVLSTPFANPCFWPIFVISSYAITEEQRTNILRHSPPTLPLVVRAVEILGWVWDSPDGPFGLEGLARAIESHRTSYCFA